MGSVSKTVNILARTINIKFIFFFTHPVVFFYWIVWVRVCCALMPNRDSLLKFLLNWKPVASTMEFIIVQLVQHLIIQLIFSTIISAIFTSTRRRQHFGQTVSIIISIMSRTCQFQDNNITDNRNLLTETLASLFKTIFLFSSHKNEENNRERKKISPLPLS